jgi:hypothetical protein
MCQPTNASTASRLTPQSRTDNRYANVCHLLVCISLCDVMCLYSHRSWRLSHFPEWLRCYTGPIELMLRPDLIESAIFLFFYSALAICCENGPKIACDSHKTGKMYRFLATWEMDCGTPNTHKIAHNVLCKKQVELVR